MAVIKFYELPSIYDQVNYVFQILDLIVAIVGIVLNTLTFMVLSRKRLSSISFSFFLRVKMISDSFILLHTFRHFSAYMFEASLDLVSPASCIILEYSAYVASSISEYALTLSVLDRTLAVVFPTRFGIMKKRYFQLILLSIVFIYAFLLYLPMPLDYELTGYGTNDSLSCGFKSLDIANIVSILSFVDLAAGSIFINNILTFITMTFILKSRRRFKSNSVTSNSATQTRQSSRDTKFAINSIALDLVYFICKTPFLIAIACTYATNLEPYVSQMLFTVCLFVYTLENANSFLTNYLVNSIFRAEADSMLGIQSNKTNNPSESRTRSTR